MSTLNPSQSQAVSHQACHLLIVAGPGTGKTHTMTHRIAKRIGDLSGAQRILAITFTNKAALEMRERLSPLLKENINQVTVGTFHSFCWQFLQDRAAALGISGAHIIDEEEAIAVSKLAWPECSLSERKRRLADISYIKSMGDEGERPEWMPAYQNLLRQRGGLDFDDVLLETLTILRQSASIREESQQTYPFIFVDEYQDVNPVQNALLKSLIGSHTQLTAIGDPHQAIYGFRGSNVSFFHTFAQDFSPGEICTLTENYRNAMNLLKASSQVMAKGETYGNLGELTTKIYSEGHLTIHSAATERAEAEYVVHQIEKLVGGISMFSKDSGRVHIDDVGGYSFGDIAIFFRLHCLSRPLEEALNRSGIPYASSATKKEKEDVADDLLIRPEGLGDYDCEKVSLMSLHASKGLEFSVVFIVGCVEDILPLNIEGLNCDREEERRLFYVGMTRAKQRLYLLSKKNGMIFGKSRDYKPSVFLEDIEEELKKIHVMPAYKKKQKQMELFSF